MSEPRPTVRFITDDTGTWVRTVGDVDVSLWPDGHTIIGWSDHTGARWSVSASHEIVLQRFAQALEAVGGPPYVHVRDALAACAAALAAMQEAARE